MYLHFTELRISREPAVIEGLNLNHALMQQRVAASAPLSLPRRPPLKSRPLHRPGAHSAPAPPTAAPEGDAIHFPDFEDTPAASASAAAAVTSAVTSVVSAVTPGGYSAAEDTRVYDRQPCILSAAQIAALDAALPPELQCLDWKLRYK